MNGSRVRATIAIVVNRRRRACCESGRMEEEGGLINKLQVARINSSRARILFRWRESRVWVDAG